MEDFAGSVVTRESLRAAIESGNIAHVELLLARFGMSKMYDPARFDAAQKKVALDVLGLTYAWAAHPDSYSPNAKLIRSVIGNIAPKVDIFRFLDLVMEQTQIIHEYYNGDINFKNVPIKIQTALCNDDYTAEFDDEIKRIKSPDALKAMLTYISLSGNVKKLSFEFSRPILLCLFDRRDWLWMYESHILSLMGFSLRNTAEECLIDAAHAQFMGQ